MIKTPIWNLQFPEKDILKNLYICSIVIAKEQFVYVGKGKIC